jgi:rubrerythrin
MVAILLLLLVLAIVVLFVAQPFIENGRASVIDSHQRSALLAERERTLQALQDLDFDNALGKIPGDEYSTQRTVLTQKGMDVLRQLDQIKDTQSAPDKKANEPVAASPSAAALSDEDIEALLAQRRKKLEQKSTGFCSHCGKPVQESDAFCPACGQMIKSNEIPTPKEEY